MRNRPKDDTRPDEATAAEKAAVSRRGFLRGAGTTAVGAGAAAAVGSKAILGSPTLVQESSTAIDPAFFGRMFPDLPPFARPSESLSRALLDIGKPGGVLDANDNLAAGPVELIVDPNLQLVNRNNDTHTAGTTFFGQFLDHDLTFDASSPLGVPTEPTQSRNTRTPVLDLDSMYGGGPTVSPQLYQSSDRSKLRIESGGQFEDVPRRSDGTAIISDPRNDENLIISGMHSAFILFHNRVVDRVRASGQSSSVFSTARRTVVRHYQWIVVHEFLRQVVGPSRMDSILRFGRRFYRPSTAFMPVEFQGAAYRFGHSMIRPSYRANLLGDNGQPFFGMIFDPAGEGQSDPVDLRGGARAPRRFIGWGTFFDFADGNMRPNKLIDTKLSTPLFNLPLRAIPSEDPPTSLPQRNLLRHITWSLPSGQSIARAMGTAPLSSGDLSELSGYGLGLERNTPLWYYILKEAEVQTGGLTLGVVGGRIVGEVFVGVMQLDSGSYLNQFRWRPTLPQRDGRVTGAFTMLDLLAFAGVDPATRGQ